MTVKLGPILALAAAGDTSWSVSAVVLANGDAAPECRYGVGPADGPEPARDRTAEPRTLETRGGARIVRYRLEIPRDEAGEQTVAYAIGEHAHRFRVPQAGKAPRMAYGSCNGFSDPAAMKDVAHKQAMWRRPEHAAHRGVLDRHDEAPLHLMLLGGDQIYADPVWSRVRGLDDFMNKDLDAQKTRKPRKREPDDLAAFYLELYRKRWTQPDIAAALAGIPSVMMWDDHDIFDGWGSYPDELLDSPTCRSIFDQAARHFDLFQRHAPPGEPAPAALRDDGGNRTAYYDLGGGVAVLALDLRSERRRDRIMGDATWTHLVDRLREIGEAPADSRPDHLLVMSSIPVVHPDLSWLEGPAGAFGTGLEDDLRDHWNSPAHKGERLRLVHRLLALSRLGTRVTFLSGDVHVGATGHVETTRPRATDTYADRLEQLTSSGIVHKAPNAIVCFALEQLARVTQDFDADTKARLAKLPGGGDRFVTGRNWIELTPDASGEQRRLWADFHVEDRDQPLTRVVQAVGGPRGRTRDDRDAASDDAEDARRELGTPSADRPARPAGGDLGR